MRLLLAILLLASCSAFGQSISTATHSLALMAKVDATTVRVRLKDGGKLGVEWRMNIDDITKESDNAQAAYVAYASINPSGLTADDLEYIRQNISLATSQWNLWVRIKLTAQQVLSTGTSAINFVNPS